MNEDMVNKIAMYIVWWVICTSRMLICRLIKNFAILIIVLGIIYYEFEFNMIIGGIIIFHPIFINKIYQFFKLRLINKYLT